MKLGTFFKDRILLVILWILFSFFLFAFMTVFQVNPIGQLLIFIVLWITTLIGFFYEYIRRKRFYDLFFHCLEELDQKYLITEVLPHCSFIEGKMLCSALYEIDKSMIEHMKEYELSLKDLKEYIELWVHEIKIPLSSMQLILHNHHIEVGSELLEQLRRLDRDVERILFYTRSEHAENDYMMKTTTLQKVVSSVMKKNKEMFLSNHVKVELQDLDFQVTTDAKWLEFIVMQLLSNSIKYKKEKNPIIRITGKQLSDRIVLTVYDNGIGIPSEDIKRVFEKSFTGKNGRVGSASTGMGLYICKNMLSKLGHVLMIESVEGEYTKVTIEFKIHDFYQVVRNLKDKTGI